MRILARYQGGSPAEIKEQYMQRVDDFETEAEVIPNRLKLRKYLRELASNQKRIFSAAADRALKEKKLRTENESREAAELQKLNADKFSPFLQALDLKLKESSTPYFDSRQIPSRSIDKAMFDEIEKKDIKKLITAPSYPDLYAWHQLIGRFTEEAAKSWPE